MKDIYYATKLDKFGNKITIGYQTEKNRDKYSGDARHDTGLIYADLRDGKMVIYPVNEKNPQGHVVHGLLVNNGEVQSLGDDPLVNEFVLYGKRDDVWSKTPYSFATYSAAATAMKSMIGSYQALLIRRDADEKPKASKTPGKYDDLTIGE